MGEQLDFGGVLNMGDTVNFYAAKGGQGCSTVAGAVAVLLARSGEDVVLLTADPGEMAALLGIPSGVNREAGLPTVAPFAAEFDHGRYTVVRDLGVTRDLPDDGPAYLVTRACFLALRAGVSAPTPSGVILIAEERRSLLRVDVEEVLGVPVVVEIPVAAEVARAIDAGLIGSRIPKSLRRLQRFVTADV